MAFFSIHSFSRKEVDFAVNRDKSTSTVWWGPRLEQSFQLPLQLDGCFPIRYPCFGFYDYGGDRAGVVSLVEGKVLWLEKVKVCDGGYIGVDEVSGELAIQREDQIFMHAAESGELVRKLLVPDRVAKIRGQWIVTKDDSRTTIHGPAKTVILDQDAYQVEMFGDKVVVIDPQRALAVVDLTHGEILRTLNPPAGSRFSGCHLGEKGTFVTGVSYFGLPAMTEVWRFESLDQPRPPALRVGCAGSYIFVEDGGALAFAAGPRYSVATGDRIGEVGTIHSQEP
jgi:hypothetical protein